MAWEYETFGPDGQCKLFGVNIFDYNWQTTGKRVKVKDPIYHQDHTFEESTCPLEKVKTEDGWADEIMAHMIRCKHCGQIFTCVVNTWRGSEHFRKGKG